MNIDVNINMKIYIVIILVLFRLAKMCLSKLFGIPMVMFRKMVNGSIFIEILFFENGKFENK